MQQQEFCGCVASKGVFFAGGYWTLIYSIVREVRAFMATLALGKLLATNPYAWPTLNTSRCRMGTLYGCESRELNSPNYSKHHQLLIYVNTNMYGFWQSPPVKRWSVFRKISGN